MRVDDFTFNLPDELIARYPVADRTASRLLCLNGNSGALADRGFAELEVLLNPGDLLVMNNTRVIPARLYGQKKSGGRVELLIERLLDGTRALAHVRANRAPKAGQVLQLAQGVEITVEGRRDSLFELRLRSDQSWLPVLQQQGHMPLPPYIDRADEATDQDRYLTVYAQHAGAVAAPTAGLHFDQALLDRLAAKGIERAFVTLHVGAGTFQPVKVDLVEDHVMHTEYLEVSAETVAAVTACRARGGRVVAVGTTSVRSLETAAQKNHGVLAPYQGESDIFIYPGYQFHAVDVLITNFHLSRSTLLMLVSAFAGAEHIKAAYSHAIAERYRFFSYGDAMLITRQTETAA